MSLRREIGDHEHETGQYIRDLVTALEQIRLLADEADGYPTHTVGASAPEARTPPIMEGMCMEWDAAPIGGFRTRCMMPRPCPEHDVNDTRLDTIERNAARNLILERDRVALIESFQQIRRLTITAHRRTRRYVPAPDIDKKAMLCTGTPSLAGYHVPLMDGGWYDEQCRNIADPTRHPLCSTCWAKEQAWRIANGLPERERTRPTIAVSSKPCANGCGRDAAPGRTNGLCDACRMADIRAKRAS